MKLYNTAAVFYEGCTLYLLCTVLTMQWKYSLNILKFDVKRSSEMQARNNISHFYSLKWWFSLTV